mmetsp:Transcript_37871/g.76609  ORF Transcript_37871/g.76609 Transcript_37871/m.76609 type:complete len:102 (+) Transcript_37871:480-785(+)
MVANQRNVASPEKGQRLALLEASASALAFAAQAVVQRDDTLPKVANVTSLSGLGDVADAIKPTPHVQLIVGMDSLTPTTMLCNRSAHPIITFTLSNFTLNN